MSAVFPSYVDAVLRNAAHDPGRPAIGTEAGVLSFGDLAAAVGSAIVRCDKLGWPAGSIVALLVDDPVRHICLICALHRLGIVSVSVTTPDSGREIGIAAVLTDRDDVESTLAPVIRVESDWFTDRSFEIASLPRQAFAPNELCRIALSSGTTGVPKAIAMSPEILWHRLTTYAMRGRFARSERVLCGPVLSSHFAFAITFSALMLGKMVCFAKDAGNAIYVISYYGVDLAVISTHQLSEMCDVQARQIGGLSTLREVQAGGSTVSDFLFRKIRQYFPCPVLNTYASTEAGTVAFGSLELLGDLRSDGAVGVIVPWASVSVRDESGNDLGNGSFGGLCISALGMAPSHRRGTRYLDAVDAFFPGDYGCLLDNRMLVIGGRSRELINIGGNKVSPEQIERLVMQCDGIEDAAAVSVSLDSDFPQIWIAVVSPSPVDTDEIKRQCGAQSRVMVPTVIKQVAHIPRNGTGKILRDEVLLQLKGAAAGAGNTPGVSAHPHR